MKRRDLLRLGALAGAGMLTGCQTMAKNMSTSSSAGRVVVVGGGPGGLAAARAVKKANPKIKVTLIEKNRNYSTCFGSNWVLGGIREMEDITFNYTSLPSDYDIQVIHDEVTGIDSEKQLVKMALNNALEYDRLIVSPGISFRWELIEGLNEDTTYMVPHAWKAGYQTLQLKSQIMAMPEDGVMVMAPPANPFRCPPGPYERASMIAHFMKQHKPKAKLLIMDAKDKFSKQGLFTAGWEEKYGFGTDNAMIEWVSKSKGGEIRQVDPMKKTLITKDGDTIKADVINFIPPQKANTTASRMGLTDESGWCPVDQITFESNFVKNVHVLGDASIATPMPKSGFSADSQGRLVGKAVAALMSGEQPDAAGRTNNQCYSLVTPDYGISVAASYQLENGMLAKKSGGLFPKDGSFENESKAAYGWYEGMITTMFK